MWKGKNKYITILIAVTGVLLLILVWSAFPQKSREEKGGNAAPVKTIVIRDRSGFAGAISTVAAQLTPTVVHVNVTGTATQRSFDFFNPFGTPQQRDVPVQGLGSGVIISGEGHVITNNHIVQNAQDIQVELFDGSSQTAELVGRDPNTDLAVLKIKPTENMKYARLGDSDAVKVGEWVIAIGSPRGFDWTVTAGIVSAKNRRNIGALGPTGYEDYIQTDASINPGNSGGPLLNLAGEVIGINSLIISGSRGSEGLGFAIPSDIAKTISESLIEHGKVVRGYIGVSIQDLTPELAEGLEVGKDFKGVLIADTLPGGPAAKAGLERGDIIVRYKGERIKNTTQLRNVVAATSPGENAKITVLRGEKEIELTVKVGDMESFQEQIGELGVR